MTRIPVATWSPEAFMGRTLTDAVWPQTVPIMDSLQAPGDPVDDELPWRAA